MLAIANCHKFLHSPVAKMVAMRSKPSISSKPSPPSVRALFIKIFAVLFLAFCFLAPLLSGRHLSNLLFPRKQPFYPPDLCHLVGVNPEAEDLWQFNSRSHCVSSHVCISAGKVQYSSDTSRTQCEILSPRSVARNKSFPAIVKQQRRTCEQFQREMVWGAHAEGMRYENDGPVQIEKRGEEERVWIEGVSVIVPHYPWPWNIYHFVNIVTDVVRIVDGMDGLLQRWGRLNVHGTRRKLNIVFQGPRKIPYTSARWQTDLVQIVKAWAGKKASVSVFYMEDLGMACVRNGIVLGERGNENAWPFLNESDVRTAGQAVGKDAVQFRRLMYRGSGVGADVFSVPPLVVGYARRTGRRDEDGYYRWGASRRLSDEDEIWLTGMLRTEAEKFNGVVRVLEFSDEELEEQVNAFSRIGMLVGVHGANLVNSVWMRPFGVLMEITPKGLLSGCYSGGLNGGLKYIRFEASETASIEETGCDPGNDMCKSNLGRMVKLGVGDRERIREKVREGLKHLVELRKKYSGTVRVHYDRNTMQYRLA